jgi:hypothetical protein
MDPNQYNFQKSMWNLMQNYQDSNSQNSQFLTLPTNPNMFYRPQMDTQGVEFPRYETQPPIGSMSECQVPQFSTQVGLENITLEEGEKLSAKKKTRELFTREEDILLIKSWLSISKDSVVGVDQKADSFWLRITSNYNEYREKLREKTIGQLKARWHRINGFVQKFVGCYKLAVRGKKSGTSEKDIMAEAHAFYCQEGNGAFNHEFAWQLLKDEPKWMGASTGCSSKRTKTSESGAYTTSSNP